MTNKVDIEKPYRLLNTSKGYKVVEVGKVGKDSYPYVLDVIVSVYYTADRIAIAGPMTLTGNMYEVVVDEPGKRTVFKFEEFGEKE